MKAQAQYTIIEVNDMDSVELGGRNLLKVTAYGTLNGVTTVGSYHTISADASNKYNGNTSLKIIATAVSVQGTQEVRQACWTNQIVGKHSMLSLYVKGSVASTMWCKLSGATSSVTATGYAVTTGWTRLEIDFGVITASGTSGGTYISFGFSVAGTFYVNSMMLEYGNKCSEWAPAPEDIDGAIKDVDNKFSSYSTTIQMNTAITQTQNAIMSNVSGIYATQAKLNAATTNISNLDSALQAEISRAQGQESALNGKFASYVLTTTYDSKVTQLQTSITLEVNERKAFSASIIGANVCDNNPITADDICKDDGETVVNQMLKDNSAKVQLMADKLDINIQDNINRLEISIQITTSSLKTEINNVSNKLSSSIEQTAERIETRVTNFENDTSSSITQLSNDISLKVSNDRIIAAINMSPETIKLSASKIDMTGYVTISDLSGGTTTISGNCITSGTIKGVTVIAGGVYMGNNTITLTNGSGAIKSSSGWNVIDIDSGNNIRIGTQSHYVTSTYMYGNIVDITCNSAFNVDASSNIYLDCGSQCYLHITTSTSLSGWNSLTLSSQNDIYLAAPRIKIGTYTSQQIGFFGATPKSRKGRPSTLDGLIDALADYGFFG